VVKKRENRKTERVITSFLTGGWLTRNCLETVIAAEIRAFESHRLKIAIAFVIHRRGNFFNIDNKIFRAETQAVFNNFAIEMIIFVKNRRVLIEEI